MFIEGDTLKIDLDERGGRGWMVIGPWLVRIERMDQRKICDEYCWKVTSVEIDQRQMGKQ